jgi:ribosomal protein S18 acetylase RimI-like enzyme
MKITFKLYNKFYFKDLEICMKELQDFIVNIDPLERLRRLPRYGKNYTRNLIKKILKQNGLIILMYDEEKIVGCIAGIIEKQSKDNLLECIPTKAGRILELFVLNSYRGLRLGKRLMQKMEDYFKKNKCDIVRVEVFVPNKDAHYFYQHLDYSDRVVDMIKRLK